MTLDPTAAETLEICRGGSYVAPSGRVVDLREALRAAVAGTTLYRPGEPVASSAAPGARGRVEVTGETTAVAARRLCDEGVADVVALNFASARHVGGGFLGGAKAQEEDLCRGSGLYVCLQTQPAYYMANRQHPDHLYTDHAIYSRRVPFFRDEAGRFLEAPFLTSVITSPAPNAGAELASRPDARPLVRSTLERRALQVLRIAADRGHRTLVLGAWGCGAFRCDPDDAAEAFAHALDATAGAFDRVVFAVYERSRDRGNRRAFEAKLG